MAQASVEKSAACSNGAGAGDRVFSCDTSVLGLKELKQDVTNSKAVGFPTLYDANQHSVPAEIKIGLWVGRGTNRVASARS